MTIALKALFITLLMWSKLTLSPVWLPTLLSRLTKPITHAFGDSESWTFAHKMNHFFVKPKQAMSDTNLVIVTDKRTYNIVLHFIGEETKKNADGTVSNPLLKRRGLCARPFFADL
jgi:hypothetical protein